MNSNSSGVLICTFFLNYVPSAQKRGAQVQPTLAPELDLFSLEDVLSLNTIFTLLFHSKQILKNDPQLFSQTDSFDKQIHITVAITYNSSCSIFLDNGYVFNKHAWKATHINQNNMFLVTKFQKTW